MAVRLTAPGTRIPALRDVALLLVIGFLVVQQGLPVVRTFAQDRGGVARDAVTNAFTYQGRLEQNGVPLSGTFDFEFELYASANGGNPIATRQVLDVVVTNGRFAVPLDFGAEVFDGQQRWLLASVRPGASNGGFDDLLPRQELTATPYALFAKASDWAGIANKPAGLDDGDQDTLSTLAPCANGQVAKYNGATWVCGTDEVSPPDGGHFGQTWTGSATTGLQIDNTAPGAVTGFAVTTSGNTSTTLTATNSGVCSAVGVKCYGIRGTALASTGGIGVQGDGSYTGVWGTGPNFGVVGHSSGIGVLGNGSAEGPAVKGYNFGTGVGVMGETESGRAGVYGKHNQSGGTGVEGESQSGFGVKGTSGGTGVRGEGSAGVTGQGTSTGVRGDVGTVSGCGISAQVAGVVGRSCSSPGVLGYSGTTAGVHGITLGTGLLDSGVIGRSFGNCPASAINNNIEGYCLGVVGLGFGAASMGVFGQASHIGVAGVGGTWAGYFTGNVGYTGSLTQQSDIRAKRDIETLGPGLEEIRELQPKRYRKIEGDGHTEYGLIAQDVQAVLPDLVTDKMTGDMLGVDYIGLIPVLINAMQEQQTQIEALGGPVAESPAASTAAVGSNGERGTWAAMVLGGLALAANAGLGLVVLRRK